MSRSGRIKISQSFSAPHVSNHSLYDFTGAFPAQGIFLRVLVSVVLVCSIVALLLVAGCTFNLKNADGSLNKSFSTNPGTGSGTGNSGGIGGGTGAGKSGSPPAQATYTPGCRESRFQLNYPYRDLTSYPQFNNPQACGDQA